MFNGQPPQKHTWDTGMQGKEAFIPWWKCRTVGKNIIIHTFNISLYSRRSSESAPSRLVSRSHSRMDLFDFNRFHSDDGVK